MSQQETAMSGRVTAMSGRVTVQGWGRRPGATAKFERPRSLADLSHLFPPGAGSHFRGIARGLGRSYGDSALASQVICTTGLDNYISFDTQTGVLHCGSGVSLGDILQHFLPRGWFLPVLPGTQFVTVGGAIASDVHGKNHHIDGSFCEHVQSLRLMPASGELLHCSASENSQAFRASCAGMGLTGIITDAHLQLRRCSSAFMDQRSIKSHNLRECFDLIEENQDAHYSVAWLDCMARGEELGRSILFLGEHCQDDELQSRRRTTVTVPFNSPAMLLNRYSMRAFNQCYFHLAGRRGGSRQHYQSYFFPLDSILHWNRLYGGAGFLQYQFVLPEDSAYTGMLLILQRISSAGKGSFLSVLKKFRQGNDNLLSFPMAGYTLALDFKYQPDLLPLLAELDAIVLHHGGRLYLCKDARMSEEVFKQSYSRWEEFAQVREQLGATGVFQSQQSLRLGI